MPTPLPSWVDSLKQTLDKTPDAAFRPLDPSLATKIQELLVKGWDQYPFGESFQNQGRARIERSIPIASGHSRTPRLSDSEQPVLLLHDPLHPDTVFASLGSNLPPQLWPSAEPTLTGIGRGLAPYLDRPFRSVPKLSRSLRVHRGTFNDLGLQSIDQLADILSRIESWLDGEARWGSQCFDDPWPEDPAGYSMLQIRALSEQSNEQHRDRRRSIAMRTLWSRSVLVIEEGLFDSLVFELRYDPAPFVAELKFDGDATLDLPDDVPVDLAASLCRDVSVTPARLEKLKANRLTTQLGYITCVMEPAETTTFDMLRTMLDDPELQGDAVDLAATMGARALLYELECKTEDESLRDRIAAMTMIKPKSASSDEDGDDEDEDEDDEDEEDEDDALDGFDDMDDDDEDEEDAQ